MSDKNAVVISLSEEDIAKMTVSYTANSNAESFPLS
jgi:hypothetical protein